MDAAKSHYASENVLEQVLQLLNTPNGAQQLTVVLDITIMSNDSLKEFTSNKEIEEQIKSGRLNIVLLWSAQKFDIQGEDNYFGGVVVTLNNPAHFQAFNDRMNLDEDQLKGLSYQGITHSHKYAAKSTEEYKKVFTENIRKVYAQLPDDLINGNQFFAVAQIEDKETVFSTTPLDPQKMWNYLLTLDKTAPYPDVAILRAFEHWVLNRTFRRNSSHDN